jgi:transposase
MADPRLEPLVLSEAERRTLDNWAKRRTTAQGLALRARIVLACAEGGSNIAVATRLGVNRGTVARWRARFLRDRLDGLSDEPRPGVPRTITDAQVEEVVVRTLEEVPEGAAHWPKRELAKRVGISPASVLRIWHAFGLQPWRTEAFKISPDPLLIDKIRDVTGLYLATPEHAAVFAVDEKPQIQRYLGFKINNDVPAGRAVAYASATRRAKAAATRGSDQMGSAVGYLRHGRSCR